MNHSNMPAEKIGDEGPTKIGWGSQFEQELAELGAEQDLDQLAEETKALVRRRGVQSAVDLLRMVLGYSIMDYSLRMLGIWCTTVGIANVSKTALLNRLRNCQQWMGRLVLLTLAEQKLRLPGDCQLRVRLIDASVICQLGSKGADWRLHLSFDLRAGCLDEIELTNGRGAERLNRFHFRPGELCIADRAYALAKSLGWILSQGAWVLVRTGWNRLALQNEDGTPFDLFRWLPQVPLAPLGAPAEVQVCITTPQGRYALRLVAQALSAAATEKARRKVREDAKKNHHTPDERSLCAAGFILLLTNLPGTDWPTTLVLQLYRFRWQIELAIKRMKSLAYLDHLRCKDPELVQVCLLGKLLGVLWLERHQLALAAQEVDAFLSTDRPISYWQLNTMLWEQIRAFVRGPFTLASIETVFPRLLRYLSDEPRKRKQQLAGSRALFHALSCA